MFRNGLLGLMVAAGLATPVWAGELDGERAGTVPAPAPLTGGGDVLGVTAGSELDGEAPSQATWFRGPRFRGGVSFNVGFSSSGFRGWGQPAFHGGGWGFNQRSFYGSGWGQPAFHGGWGFNQRSFHGGGWAVNQRSFHGGWGGGGWGHCGW